MDATEAAVTQVATATRHSSARSAAQSVHRGSQIAVATLSAGMAVVGALLFDGEGSVWMWEGFWLVRELVPATITCAVVAVLVLRHRPALAVGWSMLGVAFCWGASVLGAGLFYESLATGWSASTQFRIASHAFMGVGLFLGMNLLPQLFPTGWLSGWVWRVLLVLTVLGFSLGQGLSVMVDWEDAVFEDIAPVDFVDLRRIGAISWYFSLAVVIASLAERIRRGPQLVRQQIAPLAIMWLLSIAGIELQNREYLYSSTGWPYLAAWLWPVIVSVTIGVTVTQVGLWDTRLVVRRFAVYLAMTTVLTVVFAGAYFLVLLALSSQAVDDQYHWLALLLAALAVVAADPLRRRVRAALERRLLGERSEPLRPLGRLDALTSVADAEDATIYQTVTDTVADAVRSPGVSLALQQPTGTDVVATTGAAPDDPVVVPLLHRGERLGELRVASRTPGEPYGRSDRALLDRLAHQAAALVYGLRRDTDIASLRSEAIEALVDQRVALGRDLHDGLAPLLAGAGLTADALRRGMPSDSPDAEQAARLATRLRTAASEVRRLAHDLQPHAEGPQLPAVITDYVASLAGDQAPDVAVTMDDGATDGLTATAELALSRVALEAITNVVRHAGAAHAEVSLQRAGADLVLRVSDDGRGIAQPYVAGLGITSMRSRVQALGGTFDLTPAPGGGTTILVTVPVRR